MSPSPPRSERSSRLRGIALHRNSPRALAAILASALAVAAPLLAWTGTTCAASRGSYRLDGDCDGYPRIDVQTPPGLCVGLVAHGLGRPRSIAAIGDDWYVADMGGWEPRRGRLLRLPNRGRAGPQVVLDRLDEPNTVVALPGGKLLLGVLGRIVEIDPKNADPRTTQHDVVTGLPSDGRHPLASFARSPDGTLWINVGSRSDHCEAKDGAAPDPAKPCPETIETPPRGSIVKIVPGDQPADIAKATVVADGLRNAMALALTDAGELWAAANARDSIHAADRTLDDLKFPHDVLVKVRAGAHYGWPACYDGRTPSPEFPKADCGAITPSDALLPPHAAPLGMLAYRGSALEALAGRLLIGYHGYLDTGHRLVAVDPRNASATTEIVGNWGFAAGVRPRGTPVGLTQLDDGSVLVAEDLNSTILRLARDAATTRRTEGPGS